MGEFHRRLGRLNSVERPSGRLAWTGSFRMSKAVELDNYLLVGGVMERS